MTEHRELLVTRKDGSKHVVLYDAADANLAEPRTWHVGQKTAGGPFYAYTYISVPGGKSVRTSMHNLLMGAKGIDHINHNGLDNRRSNLRLADKQLNQANARGHRNSSSKYKGVSWRTHARKWAARIDARHLGYFADEASAARAYDSAAHDAFGEYAFLNFPGDQR